MALFRHKTTFAHGIHPPESKDETSGAAIRQFPFAPLLILPLIQHLGKPSVAEVREGEPVVRGQRIARADGFMSVSLHAPATGVVRKIADRVYVMQQGEIVEHGPTAKIFETPEHPYTKKLLECDPASIVQLNGPLPVIAGQLPDLAALPRGCIFRPRCDASVELCAKERPALAGQGHCSACHVSHS